MTATTKPNEIRIIRFYDAPLKAVWDAWTEPDQVAQWWGPRGFSLTTHSKELRPGGIWHYTMHGPDGTDWINKTLYHEVEPYARLVYDHGGNDERAPLFRVTVVFSEENGGTKMDMTSTVPTAEAAIAMKKRIREAGGESTWDRLAEYLTKERAGKEQFVINRTFEAPIELMYDMWTKAEHFARWLPPVGASMSFLEADIRPGGQAVYRMTVSDGTKVHGRLRYLALQPPERLVYTQEFCDEKGQVSRAPFAPLWPETMLTTVTLREVEPGRTNVKVVWECQGKVTPAELAAFVAERAGMTSGWTGSFDKLEALLTSQRAR